MSVLPARILKRMLDMPQNGVQKIFAKKCGQNGHVKMECMFGLEDFPLPNEILLQIFGHISGKDLEQSAKVSKRFKEICDIRKLEEKKNLRNHMVNKL